MEFFMIKFIFLDLDNTLLDFHKGELCAIERAFKELNIPINEQMLRRYMEINVSCWRGLERGEKTLHEVLYGRFEMLFSEFGIDASATEVQNLYQRLLSEEHDFIPGAKELLDKLYDSGKYRLFMTTNGSPDVQYPRIADSGIGKYFEKIFISYELGCAKPSKEYFDACFKEIDGFNKDEAIILGDSLSSDVKGGINAGIKSCHFNIFGNEYSDVIPDFTITNILDFLEVLDQIK